MSVPQNVPIVEEDGTTQIITEVGAEIIITEGSAPANPAGLVTFSYGGVLVSWFPRR